MHNIGKVSVNDSVLYMNKEICNKNQPVEICVFILVAGAFVSRDENSLLDVISLTIRKR